MRKISFLPSDAKYINLYITDINILTTVYTG